MTVKIGDVWDATVDVLARRRGALAPVALLAFLLPFAARAAILAWGGASAGAAALAGLVALLCAPLLLWGMMAVIAIAADPARPRREAAALAWRRLPAGLLAALVVVAVAVAAVVPVVVLLAASGVDLAAGARAGSGGAPAIAPGIGLVLLLYAVGLAIVALWASARLFLVQAAIVLERRWIDAFGRSFALTRGLTWRLIGVSLLFALVEGVAAFAARSVVFIVARLLLGPAHVATATWLGGVADALVTAAYIVVVGVFSARLYAALVRAPAP